MAEAKRSMEELNRLSETETAAFLKRSSVTYLECCISLMLTHLPREEVIQILVGEAEMLREMD